MRSGARRSCTAREFEQIVGESPRLHRVMLQIEQVAKTESTVLLLGETGTGKDLIATAIHGRSRRAEYPLVRVNCAALPATLIESELFGHEKGAFTGALTRRPGRFELADGGTIVLDEIGELPLRCREPAAGVAEWRVRAAGLLRHPTHEARVIASTNRDLEAMVHKGSFRADLFYRLGVFPITLPPLRERREDIPLLAAFFIEKLHPKLGRPRMRVPNGVMAMLVAYDWPGNVRELENIMERSMIVSEGAELEIDALPGRCAARAGPRSGRPTALRRPRGPSPRSSATTSRRCATTAVGGSTVRGAPRRLWVSSPAPCARG